MHSESNRCRKQTYVLAEKQSKSLRNPPQSFIVVSPEITLTTVEIPAFLVTNGRTWQSYSGREESRLSFASLTHLKAKLFKSSLLVYQECLVGLLHRTLDLRLDRRPGLGVSLLNIRVLDGQAPDVNVVADGGNDIKLEQVSANHASVNNKAGNTYHEAAIDTNRKTEARKHKRRLTIFATKYRTRPETEHRASAIQNTKGERVQQDVVVWETRLHEMANNHASDGIGADQSNVHSKRNGVVLQNSRVQVQVSRDKGPNGNQRQQTAQRRQRILTPFAAHLHNVQDAGAGGEEEHDRAVDQVPLSEGHLVHLLRDEAGLGNTEGLQHWLMPEATAAHVGCESVDSAKSEDTLDGSGDDSEGQHLSVVLIPSLHVESHGSWDLVSE